MLSSPSFVEIGWHLNDKAGLWHFIICTGSESGTGLDFFPSVMLVQKYDWFLTNQGAEIADYPPEKVTLEELLSMTKELIPLGYDAEEFVE